MKKGMFRFLCILVLLLLWCPSQVEAAKLKFIDSIDISYNEPQTGQKPGDIFVTTNTPGIKLSSVEWWCNINVNTKVDQNDTFQPGVKYYLSVKLETTGSAYEISPSNIVVYFNGTKQDYFSNRASSNVVANSVGYSMPPKTIISSVNISYNEPQMGQKPSDIIVTTNTPGMILSSVEWWCNINVNTKVGQNDTFQPGVKYYLSVKLETTGLSYEIDRDNIVVNFNGTKQDYFSSRAFSSVVANSVGHTMPEKTIINTINISFSDPKAGQYPNDIDVTTSTEGLIVTQRRWYTNTNTSTPLANNAQFQAGTAYYLEVRVETMAAQYEIHNTATMVFNASGAQTKVNGSSNYYVARSPELTIPALPPSEIIIKNLDITLTTPLIGEVSTNNFTSLSSTNASITEVRWFQNTTLMSASATFKADETYVCILTIQPQAGYAFQDTIVKLNGITTDKVTVSKDGIMQVTSTELRISHPDNAKAPQIISQPIDMIVRVGEITELAISAISTDGGVLSYQWYVNTTKKNSGGTSLGSTAQSSKVEVPSLVIGTNYYYCIVTNTKASSSGSKTATLASDAVAVDVIGNAITLHSIVAPTNISGITNGSAKTATALHLPATVTLVTNAGQVIANVIWNVDSCTYNVAKKEMQQFTVTGTVLLPSGLLNPNKVALSVEILVSVEASTTTKYTVQYHANGGTGALPATITVNSGSSYTILENMFSRENYHFLGWGTSPTGGSLYTPGTALKIEHNIILYAQWSLNSVPEGSYNSVTLVFTIDSKVVLKNGSKLPELDVPAMIINGRTMIPFRYFIETALDGVADFDATTYTITATVRGHKFVMIVEDSTIYVDGQAIELSQAPTIVDSRTLVPLRVVETIAQRVDWEPLTREATIIL